MIHELTRRYGIVLLLVTASMVVQMATAGSGLVRFVTILLQAATLVAAVRASGAERIGVRVAGATAALVALASAVVLIVDGSIPEGPAAIVSGLLVAVAPGVLAAGLVREVRNEGAVTVHTLAGVLAIYLLVGMFFAFVYGTLAAVDSGPLFAETSSASSADRLYFSFVTMCTVGYGDLTLVGDLPRTFAVAEMLIGQIYLVTVVSLIVANLGRRRPA